MLKCARQCGRRNGASKYITFGEFCVLVREMQNQHSKQHRKIQQCTANNSEWFWTVSRTSSPGLIAELFLECVNNCEVFLGGSCNPTTWRADTAIPELQKYGITFYNPVSLRFSSSDVNIFMWKIFSKYRDGYQSWWRKSTTRNKQRRCYCM
jgi:hypothetical protein